jgi:hypothetical protein
MSFRHFRVQSAAVELPDTVLRGNVNANEAHVEVVARVLKESRTRSNTATSAISDEE